MGLFSKLFGGKREEPARPATPAVPSPEPLKKAGGGWETAGSVPQELAASEVLDLYQKPDRPVFLDVREEEERRQHGFIPGSVHIPMHEIQGRQTELDPSKAVVVYCASGMRSMDVGAFLLEQGFKDVSNLNGGLMKWTGPLEKSS